MKLRSGGSSAWDRLRKSGLKSGICSNLSNRYASALMSLVARRSWLSILSDEVVVVKLTSNTYIFLSVS